MKTTPAFNLQFEFEYERAGEIAPGLRRLVAENPGPLTFKGTNTYILGRGCVAVIDPGPDDERHRDALFRELAREGERISHIFLTHGHLDHSAGMNRLKTLTGAVTCGYGPTEVRSRSGVKTVGRDYEPDLILRTGDRVAVESSWEIEALHTPGHAPDHLCYALPKLKALLTGDHVMGWNTSVIAPPEGVLADYLASLELLLKRDDAVYFPAHGDAVRQPQRLAKAFLIHRRMREAEIVACLQSGVDTIQSILPRIYEGMAASLNGAASLSLLAHLEFLVQTGRVRRLEQHPPAPPLEARYCLCDRSR